MFFRGIAASNGLLSPFMPSILGPNPYTHTHLPPHTTSTTYPYTHTHFPRNTTSTGRYHSQYQEPAPTSHAALLRSPASPVSTGGGAPVHARAVTVTSLSGVQLSTPNQPNVNSKYIRYPHADSDTTYYGELTPPPSSTSLLNTPYPYTHTHFPRNTTSTSRYHSQHQEPATTSHAAQLRSPASPVSTGGGAPAHARAVTVTPFGSAAFYAQPT